MTNWTSPAELKRDESTWVYIYRTWGVSHVPLSSCSGRDLHRPYPLWSGQLGRALHILVRLANHYWQTKVEMAHGVQSVNRFSLHDPDILFI